MIVSPRCTRRAAAPLTRIVARAALAGDRVGLEAGAVVDVDDVDLLVLEDVGGLEQVGVDRDRADVVQVAVGDRGAVDLRLEHHALHVAIASPSALWAWCVGRAAARQHRVVDQAHLADARGERQQRRRRERVERLERVGVDERHVLGLDAARRASPRARASSSAAAERSPARGQRSRRRSSARRQRERARALGRASSSALRLDIARPSGSRTVGQRLDPHGQVQVARPAGG